MTQVPLLKTTLDSGDAGEIEILYQNVSVPLLPVVVLCLDDETPKLQKGSDGARSDDAAMLKKNIVTWVNELWGPSKPPLSPHTKEGRGFSNEFTAQLLCPSEWCWDDDEQVLHCIE